MEPVSNNSAPSVNIVEHNRNFVESKGGNLANPGCNDWLRIGVDKKGRYRLIKISELTHIIDVGQSGSGKSRTILLIITHLILKKLGYITIEPHGPLSKDIARVDPDVIMVYPHKIAEYAAAVQFRNLEEIDEDTVNELMNRFKGIYSGSWGNRIETIFYGGLLALIDIGKVFGPQYLTWEVLARFLTDEDYRAAKVVAIQRRGHNILYEYFTKQFPKYAKEAESVVWNTLSRVLNNTKISKTLSVDPSNPEAVSKALDFTDIIRNKKRVCVNLHGLDETTQKFLGAYLVMAVFAAVSKMEDRDEKQWEYWNAFFLIVDEAQLIPGLEEILNKFRKFNIKTLLATQSLAGNIVPYAKGILARANTVFAFRIGDEETYNILSNVLTVDYVANGNEAQKKNAVMNLRPRTFLYSGPNGARGQFFTADIPFPEKYNPRTPEGEAATAELMKSLVLKHGVPVTIDETVSESQTALSGSPGDVSGEQPKEIVSPPILSPEELSALRLKEAGVDLSVTQWLTLKTLFDAMTDRVWSEQYLKLTELQSRTITRYGFKPSAVMEGLQIMAALGKVQITGPPKAEVCHISPAALRRYFFQFPVNESQRGGSAAHTSAIAKILKLRWSEGNSICRVDTGTAGSTSMADIVSVPVRMLASPGPDGSMYSWAADCSVADEIEAHPSSHWKQVAENVLKNQHHSEVHIWLLSDHDFKTTPEKLLENGVDPSKHHYSIRNISELKAIGDSCRLGDFSDNALADFAKIQSPNVPAADFTTFSRRSSENSVKIGRALADLIKNGSSADLDNFRATVGELASKAMAEGKIDDLDLEDLAKNGLAALERQKKAPPTEGCPIALSPVTTAIVPVSPSPIAVPETPRVSESQNVRVSESEPVKPRPYSFEDLQAMFKADNCNPGEHKPDCPRVRKDIAELLEGPEFQFRVYRSEVDGSIVRARCYVQESEYSGKEFGRQKRLEREKAKSLKGPTTTAAANASNSSPDISSSPIS